VFSSFQFSWAGHVVGEPELEKLPIWQKCCAKQDCVSEQVKIMGKDSNGMVSVAIEGVQTSVAKQKFSPVPSPPTLGFATIIPTVKSKTTTSGVSCIHNEAGPQELHMKARLQQRTDIWFGNKCDRKKVHSGTPSRLPFGGYRPKCVRRFGVERSDLLSLEEKLHRVIQKDIADRG
jgi:hypothetical protein